jgi:flagellar basal-body rod protein FlgG
MNGEGQLVTTDGFKLLGVSPEAIEAVNAAQQALQNATIQSAANQTTAPPTAEELQARAEAEAAFQQVNPFRVTSGRSLAQESNPSSGGNEALQPISIPQTKNRIVITPAGRIYDGDQLVGALVTAEVARGDDLKKFGHGMYEYVNANDSPRPSMGSQVIQGFLEESNVNTVSELVNLMKANRIYESSMKAIKAYNDMAGKEANEVGKL